MRFITASLEGDVGQEIVEKYKTVVNWGVYRYQTVSNAAKRRKVSAFIPYLVAYDPQSH